MNVDFQMPWWTSSSYYFRALLTSERREGRGKNEGGSGAPLHNKAEEISGSSSEPQKSRVDQETGK